MTSIYIQAGHKIGHSSHFQRLPQNLRSMLRTANAIAFHGSSASYRHPVQVSRSLVDSVLRNRSRFRDAQIP